MHATTPGFAKNIFPVYCFIRVSKIVVPRDQLECFLHLVERLGQKRLVKTAGLQAEFSFRFHHQHGVMFAAREPDPEDLESYLLPFRQLLLQKEPASLGRITNLLAQGLTNDELRLWLNESRQQWKRALHHSGMRLMIRGHCCPANDLRPADKPFFLRELHGNPACRDLNGNWS
jgi:hypothetical protein